MVESAIKRSFRPHWAHIISFLGNGSSAVEMGQITEQVPHW